MYLSYDTLSEELRQQVEGRGCRHDSSRNSAGELRRGFTEVTDPRSVVGARRRPPDHPRASGHGRKALFLGRRHNAYIQGLDLTERERLFDKLWAHASARS